MLREVAPNVFSIPVPLPNNPLKNLNAYLIRGERSLLIDTGFRQEPCRKALTEALTELGTDMERTDIFLTHLHSDHAGLAPDLAAPRTKIFISEVDRHYLPGREDTFSWQRSDAFFLVNGFPAAELRQVAEENPAKQLAPAPYDDYLPVFEGDTFSYGGYTLEAINTPGHTPGHQCLYEREHKMLFLGDHVLFDITPNITAWAGTEDSLGNYLTSLRKLLPLEVKLPLPAHRASGEDFTGRVRALLDHHDRRCREVVKILKETPELTAYQVAARMTWQIRCRNWEEFPLAQKWFAVGEAIAHLEHLAAEGIISAKQQADRQIRYAVERRERP